MTVASTLTRGVADASTARRDRSREMLHTFQRVVRHTQLRHHCAAAERGCMQRIHPLCGAKCVIDRSTADALPESHMRSHQESYPMRDIAIDSRKLTNSRLDSGWRVAALLLGSAPLSHTVRDQSHNASATDGTYCAAIPDLTLRGAIMSFHRSRLPAVVALIMASSVISCAVSPGPVSRSSLAAAHMHDSQPQLPIDERSADCHDLFSERFSLTNR
jgi:hypothetical protein